MPWAKTITLVSLSPTKLSVVTKSLVGVRARYLQPLEDNVIGGGCAIVDAAIEGIARTDDGLQVTMRPTADSQILHVDADDVINATGFITPLRDLPKIGVATFGQSKLPAQTDWWQSASVPGIYFAGTITQGAPSVSKFGIPPNSGAVHGHRYNAQILAKHLATTEFGQPSNDPVVPLDEAVTLLLNDVDQSPALWHQRGYLARNVLREPDSGFVDRGTVPLTTFIDQPGRDGVALTMETDGTGAIYPVLYVRKGGSVSEHQLEQTGFPGQATPNQGRELRSAVEDLAS